MLHNPENYGSKEAALIAVRYQHELALSHELGHGDARRRRTINQRRVGSAVASDIARSLSSRNRGGPVEIDGPRSGCLAGKIEGRQDRVSRSPGSPVYKTE